MSFEKIKSDTFVSFGGINSKISTYITGLHEVLDLQNFDFTRPGSWSTRWGSTQYIGQTLASSARVLGLNEYEKLTGQSVMVIGTNSYQYAQWGTTLFPLFLQAYGFTYTPTFILGVTYTFCTGASPLVPAFGSNLFDYRTFVNTLFFSNGSSGSFTKYAHSENFGVAAIGLTPAKVLDVAYLYSLPPGASTVGFTTLSPARVNTGLTGIYQIGYGWLDVLGFRSAPILLSAGVSLNGISFGSGNFFLSTSLIPWEYGATAISIYSSRANGSQLFLLGDSNFNSSGMSPNGRNDANDGRAAFARVATLTVGWAAYDDFNTTNVPIGDPAQFPLFFTACPKYLEIYNNQLFLAGFTTYYQDIAFATSSPINYQSRLYWSEVGEPEFIDPTFFDEVRTNDGDRITGLKAYQGSLMIFKTRSFHQLAGTSATDIAIRQVSDQYGCLSNKCAVVYNQVLLFLDRKGIIKWDGANITIASNKIEPVFTRMNLTAAIDNAVGIHFKNRNEVWFGIPVDGATLNNLTVVYDYFSDAWTTFSGFNPSVFATGKGSLTDFTTLYGSYSGAIFNFGASLPSDNGQAITAVVSTLFYRDLGTSVEKQWRRLFLNVDPVHPGSTVTINLIPDFGSSIAATRYMNVTGFQDRIDFGVPAKSLQFQMIHANATLPIKINGITVESRFQRSV